VPTPVTALKSLPALTASIYPLAGITVTIAQPTDPNVLPAPATVIGYVVLPDARAILLGVSQLTLSLN